jgi:serine beta-lactamase-like protein LACTB, mitochondrial
VPVTPGTRFRIGHASKALTSAGVGLLLEKDRLHLGDEIQTYVPAFHGKQWPVTLRQLMGHMAGVRHYRNEADYMPSAHCERASEALQSFADDPLQFEPETQYKYSTFGWILVSAAVEAAADEPFFTFMRRLIFEPLGMVDTTSDSGTEVYRWVIGETRWRVVQPAGSRRSALAGRHVRRTGELSRDRDPVDRAAGQPARGRRGVSRRHDQRPAALRCLQARGKRGNPIRRPVSGHACRCRG